MARRYFGTDGMRGRAGAAPMNSDIVMRMARAAAGVLGAPVGSRVLVGRDTRASCDLFEAALSVGFMEAGLEVVSLGVLPTPAVARLVSGRGAALGVMISASHNPAHDNGVKLFGPDGFKLDDATEAAIEAAMDAPTPPVSAIGRRLDDADVAGEAEAALLHAAGGVSLSGLKIVLDCAHGAASQLAPAVLRRLGAELTVIGAEPDGLNINDGVGSTHPEALIGAVTATGSDLGVALDGDADRLILVDERGTVIDGDQLIGLIAGDWAASGRLRGGGVVTTVMSNLGLERHLAGLGLDLVRTTVGDRYVVEAMRSGGFNLGGEQSGHIVLMDHATTGDGLLAALCVLSVQVARARPLSEIAHVFEPAPQKLVSIRYGDRDPLEMAGVRAAIEQASAALGKRGRLVVRKSGTEPLIRVMAEALDPGDMERALDAVIAVIEAEAG